ncbi:hypothetical protein [Pontimicrobium sp. IMCC45349]|jgi:hypothetical protein|uniref:hypothetical protein n=1 Tax=Pontimicrobium sp. IMCC45349 TaxID=3391574 RepID=UPI0039A14DAB
MKLIHYINTIVYLITIIPYITIKYAFLGMYAQILLGITQLIIGIILVIFINRLTKKQTYLLKLYWLFTLTIIALMSIVGYFEIYTSYLLIPLVFILPMCIATYSVYLTYLIQKK